MDFRNKASNHLFLLLALLPIPRFTNIKKKDRGIMESRIFHQCQDIVLEPLKKAAQIGVMMADPLGWRRYCYTPLAAYIVDTPESALISGVAGKTSSITMASYKQFGDNFRHEPRTASTTIAQLSAIEDLVDPWDLKAYAKEAMKHRLNGVHRPFWRNWPLSDPSIFLTPEPLHHWHKQFWDHDAKWCINAVGASELDFRFAVLHFHTGYRHFKEGISALKQVTGRDHRNVQRYIVGVISGAVPNRFLVAIRALMDFRYLAQSTVIDNDICTKIEEALLLFHENKQAIIDAKARRGKGSSLITNWYIPKLEFLQSVISSIKENGAAIQWSADTTEHAHIEVVKDPARSGNGQDYEAQICRYLDRLNKLSSFDLATALRDAHVDFRALFNIDLLETEIPVLTKTISSSDQLLSEVETVASLSGTRHLVDYFALAKEIVDGQHPTSPKPYRTGLCSQNVVFHLTRDPSYKQMLVDDVALLHKLPDLRAALGDYLQRVHGTSGAPFTGVIGGRRFSAPDCDLPFTKLEIWNRVYLQSKSYHYPHSICPTQTINVFPPSTITNFASGDTVIANLDSRHEWPHSGLQGALNLILPSE